MKNKQIAISIAKIDLENGQLPEWYPIFTPGWNQLVTGEKYLVDLEAFGNLSRFVAGLGRDIVFDYEHQTLSGEQAPAAGWIKDWKFDPATGIMARIEWTEKAKGYIVAGEYRYFSPVAYYRNKTDQRLVGINSVALTNSPKTINIMPLVAKMEHQPNDSMKETAMLTKILAKIGLPDDATEEQVMEAIAKIMDKPAEAVAKDVLTALDLAAGDVSAVVASIHALKQVPKGMVPVADFEALKAKITEKEAADAVAAAMAVGKITPDQKDWATDYAKRDLPGFGTFVAKAPVVIPVTPLPGMTTEPSSVVDDNTMAVAKFFGNTAEDLKKYGAK